MSVTQEGHSQQQQKQFLRAGVLVLSLWEETHVPKVVGSNPSQHRILDGRFFTLICCKICNDVCLKRPKINDKRGRGWPIFIFKKTIITRSRYSDQMDSVLAFYSKVPSSNPARVDWFFMYSCKDRKKGKML